MTVAGTIFGTLAYLAPEAAEGMDAVDGRSDLYSLGLIGYEMTVLVQRVGSQLTPDLIDELKANVGF